jgi:hypothetical protein
MRLVSLPSPITPLTPPAVPERKPLPPSDDDLDELPAIDGGAEGDEVREPTDEDNAIDDSPADGALDPFEDDTGEDDPLDDEELDTADDAAGWIDEEQGADALDLGESELSSFDGERDTLGDVEEPRPFDEDYGLALGSETSDLDAGEEGPLAEDAPLRDEDLPELDADGDGEMDEADLIDPGFASEERAALVWTKKPWKTVGAPLDLGPVRAIACAGRGVVAATTTGLTRVDLEGSREALAALGLEGTTVRLAAEGALLAAVTDTGALFVSNDSGEHFRRAAACAAGRGLSDVVVERGIMWGLTVEGTLFRSDDYGASWHGVPALTKVLRIALHPARGVIAVTPAGVLAVGAEPFASVPGAPGGGLWSAADGIGDVTAMAFLDDAGALLVAMHRDAEDVTWLVRLPARATAAVASASGSIDAARPEVVAEVGALAIRTLDRDRARAQEDDLLDGAATAMARDDAHGVLWVSGGFGLFAYEPS